MARIGAEQYEAALTQRYVREMDFTGKPMKGFVYIEPAGFERDDDLRRWLALCESFINTLPARL